MARPRERGGDIFCLADTGLKDDDITPVSQAWECYKPLVFIPFDEVSSSLAQFGKNTCTPAKQFAAAHVHLNSQVHWEIFVLKDDNNESDHSSS